MSYWEETDGQYNDMLEEHLAKLEKEAWKQVRLDNMYMEIAEVFGKQSVAWRSKVGAVLVKDNNIISSGWNGTPAGFNNDCEHMIHGNLVTKPEVLHAELNCLAKIAASTQSSEGATMYITLAPCIDCAKLVIQSKVTRVVYKTPYRDDSGLKLLEQAKITVEQVYELEDIQS